MDVDGAAADAEALVSGLSAAERDALAAALAAGLSCDPSLRRACAEGAAMLGFAPALMQAQGAGGGGEQEDAEAAEGALRVPDLLAERAAERAVALLTGALRRQRAAAGAAPAAAAADAHAAAGSAEERGLLLLAPVALAGAEARAMQLPLLMLEGLAAAADGAALLADATAWGLQLLAAAHADIEEGGESTRGAGAASATAPLRVPPAQRRAAASLLPHARALLRRAERACAGGALDQAALQQLAWLLQAVAGGAPLRREAAARQLLPALLHELWFRWQGGACALMAVGMTTGSDRSGGAAAAQHAAAPAIAGPVALHSAGETAAILALLDGGTADVRTKAARLQQLRLAARHLARRPQALVSPGAAAASTAAAAVADPESRASWRCLRALLAQVLLAHTTSMPSADASRRLRAAALALAAWPEGAGADGSAAAAALLSELAALLEGSCHDTLREAAPQLLLPCIESALLQGGGGGGGGAWERRLSALGRAWALLGAARLQLVAPPAGVDPAGKYGLKRDALLAYVQHMLQLLPGGPDAAPALSDALSRRAAALGAAARLAPRCVPRPDPPRYLALQQEVAAFCRGLGRPQRLLAIVAALARPEAAAAAAAPQGALQEADMWAGSAEGWAARMPEQYPGYEDICQPVQLAVAEACHGLGLMRAAARGGGGGGAGAGAAAALTAGLLSFPAPTARSAALLDTAA
ncbi:hypothetical protein MNEG_16082, partial [Monoraphidium neglectum]